MSDWFGFKRRKNEKEFNQCVDVAITQELSFFQEALAQHLNSYDQLDDIANSQVNPKYATTNYQQQAGYSAEIKHVARFNAESIMDGKSSRIACTENNHPQFDHAKADKNNNLIFDKRGNYVEGTQQKNFSQVKNYNKLLSTEEYEHYKDAKIAVPPDQFNDIISMWDKNIEELKQKSERLRAIGNYTKANEVDVQIKKTEDVKSRTIPSKVSTTDAMEARKSPLLSTCKDIGRVAHRCGVESMKMGATVGAGISLVRNSYNVMNGKKEVHEAVFDVAVDMGKAAVTSYASGAATAAVGGALKATSNQICKNLSKGSGPAAIVNTGVILAKNVIALSTGKVTTEEFVKNIGQEGATLAMSVTGSNLGAVVGTCVMPGVGSIVGGVVGGMVASMLSGAMYSELLKTITDTKLSNQQRAIIAEYCKKLKEQEIEYRERVNECLDYFLDEKESQIKNSFAMIAKSIEAGTSIHSGLEHLGETFNKQLAFSSTEEFRKHIDKGTTLKL